MFLFHLWMIFVFAQVTGKKLLEKGELQRRYTIIPLNKISAKTLSDRVVNTAKSLVSDPKTSRFFQSDLEMRHNS